nr:PLP-dependent aminotransferase family protein [uncultured Blautia sp.]
MLDISKNEKRTTHLYMEVYEYYRQLILDGKMAPGSKLPSLRKCSQELKLSRTTIETAYLQLAADGYIMAKSQSGYYVTEIASHQHKSSQSGRHNTTHYRYDLASSGVDKESFRFDLWSRYMKSALRQNDRMLTYGEPQGEADLRETLAHYIRERRNILCSPDDIVVSASFQNLLQILCPLIHEVYPEFHQASFPTPSFVHGSTIFGDYGYDIHYRDKDCDVVYVSPAHMTKWGEIMPVKRRLELLKYADVHHHLIIEDDFENEFVYFQKPTPSLFGLSGGQGVVYIGSFSRLLLPSIRISFMILPQELLEAYKQKSECYNQTASKAEQIALCQFIRDGHLAAQTRRLKRLYSSKLKELRSAIRQVFGTDCQIQAGSAGTSLALTLPCKKNGEELKKQALKKSLHLQILKDTPETVTLLMSCSSMPVQDFVPACELLRSVISI